MKKEPKIQIPKEKQKNLKSQAKFIAINIRNQLEDFHVENIPDSKMKELNTIIRNSIYSAMLLMERANIEYESGNPEGYNNQVVKHIFRIIPHYWESPKEVRL